MTRHPARTGRARPRNGPRTAPRNGLSASLPSDPGATSRTGPEGAPRNGPRDRDRGQAAIEFIGFLPLLLLLALAGVQLGLAAYTAQQAGTAARTAARYVSQDDDRGGASAGRAALSGWLADDAAFTERRAPGEVTVTATVTIPSVLPGVSFGSVEKSATMPRQRELP
ncbi:pilus assembly protein [Streptomyces sp. JJ66]|uniref:TadE/TadG family type IV pilus assembly protein n=1 Tax=Streptomyces sp. JJ66 TaxID=2803843 RepID=UPI001C58C7E8|nr:TadE/TadG family type IV pilus assembly protein [Streptomyces sp. JJ66]MBW1602786.1 pilus assembly protein [Streptomyces sp. JJ66]